MAWKRLYCNRALFLSELEVGKLGPRKMSVVQSFAFADNYIKQVGNTPHTPISRLAEGQCTGSEAFDHFK